MKKPVCTVSPKGAAPVSRVTQNRKALAGLFALCAAGAVSAQYKSATLPGPYASPALLCEAERVARSASVALITPTMTPQVATCRVYLADGALQQTTVLKAGDSTSVLWSDYLTWAAANPPAPAPSPSPSTPTFVVEPAPMTEEKLADQASLFWSFLLIAVVCWGLRRILAIFSTDEQT